MPACVKAITVALICFVVTGCASFGTKSNRDYLTLKSDSQFDTAKARKLNRRACESIQQCGDLCKIVECDPCDPQIDCACKTAERLLKQSLAADVTFAPAHNNLGKVYLHQGKYYLAAWEYEYAKKLLPDRFEPLNNLGMVYESVGRLETAIASYEMAASMAPRNAHVLGNLIRARMKNGEGVDEVEPLLKELVFIDSRCDWREWAEEQLALRKIKANYAGVVDADSHSDANLPEFNQQFVEPNTEQSRSFGASHENLNNDFEIVPRELANEYAAPELDPAIDQLPENFSTDSIRLVPEAASPK